MMVEVMCGILGGGPFGLGIRHWSDEEATEEANLVMDDSETCKGLLKHLVK